MDSMFDKLTGRDNPAKKLQKEIESIQFKKQSMVSAMQAEIREAAARRDGILYQVGRMVYDNREQDQLPDDVFAGLFTEIATLDIQISIQESKIAEISQRYDEEAGMLAKMLNQQMGSPHYPNPQATYPMPPQPQNQALPLPQTNQAAPMYQPTAPAGPPAAAMPQPAPGPGPGQSPCPQCGVGYTPGVDGFCINCGQNLIPAGPAANVAPPEPVANEAPAEPAANEVPSSFCSNCGSKYVAGESLFCEECGEKL